MPDVRIQHLVCANMLMALCQPKADPTVSSCRVDHCTQPSGDRTQIRVTLAKDTDELGEIFACGVSVTPKWDVACRLRLCHSQIANV